MTEEGLPYGPQRYKDISRELYLISKHTNTSYEDAKKVTPLERNYMLEFIMEDLERQKEIYDRAKQEANKN